MHIRLFILFLLGWGIHNHTYSQSSVPIGQWTDHLPYSNVKRVDFLENNVIAATPYAIFSLDEEENSIWKKSKINGLSETGIVDMKADPVAGRIVIIYSNGIIDIVEEGNVHSIEDIRRNNDRDPVELFSVTIEGSKAYISSSIGIFSIDLNRREISGTFIIGSNGDRIPVHHLTVLNNELYATTGEGIKKASLVNNNLQDYRNWQTESPSFHDQLIDDNNFLYAVRNDSLFKKQGNWSFLYHTSSAIIDLTTNNNNVVITSTDKIEIINSNGQIILSIKGGLLQKPQQARISGDDVWIADASSGLLRFNNSFDQYLPGSPSDIITGQMIFSSNGIWASAGRGNNNLKEAGIFNYSNGEWKNINSSNTAQLKDIKNVASILYDPVSKKLYAGTYGYGLIKIDKDQTVEVIQSGSYLSPVFNDPNSFRVTGLAKDLNDYLWIANDGATDPIIALKDNGTAYKFRPPFSLNANQVGKIIVDDINQKWIIAPGIGLICLNDNGTPENPVDDQWKLYATGQGNGNLPNLQLLDIVKDQNNFIWIGTESGIAIIQCTEQVFGSQPCDATLPVVQQGNFAGYLFRGERVQSIQVDGANRKWVGTTNGAWLISEDGEKTMERFTINNSPLPSNDIHSMVVDDLTGEVYFGTNGGLVSFRGNATAKVEGHNPVKVFPNPVPPGYNGTIAIRGVPSNSIVKITELNGRLVFQGRSNGTQFTWDGKNYQGRNIASGVYLVLARDGASGEKLITKIVIIGQ